MGNTESADPLAVVRAYWDRVWIERDLDALDDLMTDPTVRHNADGSESYSPEQLKGLLRDALGAVRTKQVTFDAVCVDGDMVWVRVSIATVSLATSSPLPIVWLGQYRIEDGRIAESWTLHQTNCDWSP